MHEPVVGVHAPRHRLTPGQQNIEPRPEGLVPFRWPKERPPIGRERLSTRTDLMPPLATIEVQKERVVLCMVGNCMTMLDRPADDVWMLPSLSPNHEKGR